MKTWTYRNRRYTMEKTGYGQYTLNGYHTTNSLIYDYCDDDEQPEKMREARIAAERFVSSKINF